MSREHYSELVALVAVGEARSFTKAASELGIAQSTLSHTIRQLEARIGVRLVNRTTRSVSLTEPGVRLLQVAAPRLKDIAAELRSIADFGKVPSGTVRFSATDHAIETLLWPKLKPFLTKYPQVNIDLNVDYSPSGATQSKFDFGVRLGDELSKDIVAVPIGPDIRFAIVASPEYFSARSMPKEPDHLVTHECLNLRLANHEVFHWALKKDSRVVNVQASGRLTFNGVYQALNAALAGFGIAYLPEDIIQRDLMAGRLVAVLPDWWQTFAGYHMYYSPQRELSRAMRVLIDELNHPM